MYLKKVHIKNYKAIEELDIDLKPGGICLSEIMERERLRC